MDTDDVNMEEQDQKIIRIINRIKKNRNRACLQNILSFANREENKMEMEEVKTIVDKLIALNVIINAGVNGKESFRIVEEINILPTCTQTELENGGEDITNLETFINTSFYKTIDEKIKDEVQHVITETLKSNLLNKSSELHTQPSENFNDRNTQDNEKIYHIMANQITFLQNELIAKNEIIKLLINDRNISNNIKDRDASSNVNMNKKTHVQKKSNLEVIASGVKTKDGEIINANTKHITINNTNDIELVNGQTKDEMANTKKRNTVILSDSIIKDIESYKMRQVIGKSEKLFIKSFAGANIEAMEHYVKPTKKHENDLIILHFGTNDLRSNTHAHEIAQGIINVVVDMKTENNELMISGIITRRDNIELDKKGMEVNERLKSLCSVYNFNFINNSCISKERHLNNGGLHLNIKGTYALANNLLESIRL